MKPHTTLRGRRVDAFRQALEVGTFGIEIAHYFNQMRQGAPDAIHPPDGEHVTRLQTRKQLVEFEALGRRTGHLVSDNLFASRRLEASRCELAF